MDLALSIIKSLTKIQERSNIFKHGREADFDGINLAEVHCIDWIGSINLANVTRVANEMEMTRGAICKICKKLLAKGLIESYQLPENNKEIYYRLTGIGQVVFDEHKKCHDKACQQKIDILQTYSEHEQNIILCFLNDINRLHESRLASMPESDHICCLEDGR